MGLPKNRYSEIDLVKTFAILSVVLVHICSLGRYYHVRTGPWYATLFWRCAPTGAVPLFFMSNGALLLDPQKELSLNKLLLRKLPRLLVPLFFWATAYMLFDLSLENSLTLSNIFFGLKEILLFRHKYHLYFLHIMLLVYIFLPLTRFFLSKAGKKELRYLLVLWFFLGILYPTLSPLWPLRLVSGIPDQWALNLAYCAIGYSIVGYLIHKSPPTFCLSMASLIAGFAIVFLGTAYKTTTPGAFYNVFLSGNTIGVFLYSVGIFGLCCRRKGKMKPLSQKLAYVASEASFCIYLVHVFFITLFVQWKLSPDDFPRILSLPLLALLAIALSFPVYLILSHIPIVKKWLI